MLPTLLAVVLLGGCSSPTPGDDPVAAPIPAAPTASPPAVSEGVLRISAQGDGLRPLRSPAREPIGFASTFSGLLPTTGADGRAPDWPPRVVDPQDYEPFAEVGGVVLHHPAAVVERVGFHQSNHEGARDLTELPQARAPLVLDSRDRLTGPRTAADVVVAPDAPIAAPVTGTVLRAGTYTLYCEHTDGFVVIAPDAQPSWEVKILHISDVQVTSGMRVEAGVSLIAARPTLLPFRSQVDDHTGEPSWPHAHIEVVDPSIPNIPNGGSGC